MSDNRYTWREGDYECIASRTATCPQKSIPSTERWTLEVFGQYWYMCRCLPTLAKCRAATKVLPEAMQILERSDNAT